ncbi:TPA: transposase, partial [Burkholderia cepacia ATCC 25416]|nr:transposase [Burkholderia cepacia ATCC 25416]
PRNSLTSSKVTRLQTSGSGPILRNGFVESFNGKLRAALPNRERFRSRAEAKMLIERRPHSAHRYRPPATVRRAWLDSGNIDAKLTA